MTHFWARSGHLLLDHADGGGLVVTDDYLKAFLAREELLPPEEACDAERALHARLMHDPRASVTTADTAAVADADARENWGFVVNLRDRLLAAPTIEAAYRRIVDEGAKGIPPLFLGQLMHVIMRNALNSCEDAFTVRAGELFFRSQRATLHEGTVLLADAEVIGQFEEDRHASPLLSMLGGPAATELDVLKPDNADRYWARSDGYDMVLDLGGEPSGRKAIADAMRLFIAHMHGFDVAITPMESIEDRNWRWFVGLDTEATRLGNQLWKGETPGLDEAARIISLFRLDMPKEASVRAELRGAPVYLLMAMDKDRMLRFKPQNLIAGLPLQARKAA
jgi:hypothetical protein